MNVSLLKQIDSLCWDLLSHIPSQNQWLLKQTLYTAPLRRQLVAALPFHPGDLVADLGTGYGVMAVEMAETLKVQVIGVDIDTNVLAYARVLTESIYGLQAPVQFIETDVYHLPFADQSLDGITARFLFQHLNNPLLLAREIFRVLKPGARVFIEDIDDGFTMEFPALPHSWQIVIQAFRKLQSLQGGDRFIGRKIPSYMHQAHLAVEGIGIRPLAQFSEQNPHDIAHQFERERIEQVLPELFTRHLLTESQWQAALRDLLATEGQWLFQSVSQFQIMGYRPR